MSIEIFGRTYIIIESKENQIVLRICCQYFKAEVEQKEREKLAILHQNTSL